MCECDLEFFFTKFNIFGFPHLFIEGVFFAKCPTCILYILYKPCSLSKKVFEFAIPDLKNPVSGIRVLFLIGKISVLLRNRKKHA